MPLEYDRYQTVNPTEIAYNIDIGGRSGEMPSEMLVAKFEETAYLNDGEDLYENYARGTLKDQSPDPITLEQNEKRRNYNSKGFLNVLHKDPLVH